MAAQRLTASRPRRWVDYHVKLAAALDAALVALARRDGLSVNALFNRIVSERLARRARAPRPQR